jgi:hypothetical protein
MIEPGCCGVRACGARRRLRGEGEERLLPLGPPAHPAQLDDLVEHRGRTPRGHGEHRRGHPVEHRHLCRPLQVGEAVVGEEVVHPEPHRGEHTGHAEQRQPEPRRHHARRRADPVCLTHVIPEGQPDEDEAQQQRSDTDRHREHVVGAVLEVLAKAFDHGERNDRRRERSEPEHDGHPGA